MRPEPLVGRGDQRIAAERPEIDGMVRRRVHGVDVDAGARRVREPRHGRHVGHRADDVARRGERHPPRALREHRGHRVGLHRQPLGVRLDDAQRRTRPLRRELPRADVRVVVEAGDDELVAGTQPAGDRAGEAEGQRAHARSEHDALGVGAEQRADRGARVVGHRPRPSRGRERSAVVRERAAGEVLSRRGDRRVYGLGAAWGVEARPAVAEAGEAGAVETHPRILLRTREPRTTAGFSAAMAGPGFEPGNSERFGLQPNAFDRFANPPRPERLAKGVVREPGGLAPARPRIARTSAHRG